MLIFNATIYPVQEKFYGREVILADRDMVEQDSGLSDHITCSRLIICSCLSGMIIRPYLFDLCCSGPTDPDFEPQENDNANFMSTVLSYIHMQLAS